MQKHLYLLSILVLGCGTKEYEELAQDTIHYLQEIEDAEKKLGSPIKYPETKDTAGNVISKDVFLRLPTGLYSDLSKSKPEQGSGYRAIKFPKNKGGTEIPRLVILAFAEESEGADFKDGFLQAMDAKDSKENKPKFKFKDGLDVLQYETKGHERNIIFLVPSEKMGVVFQFDNTPGQEAKQDDVAQASMRFFRLGAGASEALSKYQINISSK